MEYKLYENNSDEENIVFRVLKNRGIENPEKYLNLDESVMQDKYDLENIGQAAGILTKHIIRESPIGITVDTDPDGYISAAMLYDYIYKFTDSRSEFNHPYPLKYFMHKIAKSHDLSDLEISDDIKLLIIPDAGTNDSEACKRLKEKGIDIIILDHHEKECENPYAIIVNNQTSPEYKNKSLCGAGIVYRFLQVLDEIFKSYGNVVLADDYLDICALANISDVMDMRSLETKYIVERGLSEITNKCFKAFIEKQSYYLNDHINIHNIQWCITPLLNGMIRFGSYEDKELLFRAFAEIYEEYNYKKRDGTVVREDIYQRAARLSQNAKSKQDRARVKSFDKIFEVCRDTQDKVIMADVTDLADGSLTGLEAAMIASSLQKPCILLRRYENEDEKIIYKGSARNTNNSNIHSFKDVVAQTKEFSFAKGHSNAFGVEITAENLNKAIVKFNKILKDMPDEKIHIVDFILDAESLDTAFVMDLRAFDDLSGQGIEKPTAAVENIEINLSDVSIIGKNDNTLKFIYNDITYIMFNCTEGNPLYDYANDIFADEALICLNAVGTPEINNYNGILTPQFVIKDLEITDYITSWQ